MTELSLAELLLKVGAGIVDVSLAESFLEVRVGVAVELSLADYLEDGTLVILYQYLVNVVDPLQRFFLPLNFTLDFRIYLLF